MSENIFNLDDKDLPEFLKIQLKALRASTATKNLLSLFDIKNELSTDEILVGLYRKFKIKRTRIWVHSTIYNLGRRNLVEKIKDSKKYRRNYDERKKDC